MSSSEPLPQPPLTPGVGARRKGVKVPPSLPASAFSPPSTGVSDRFPLPASPSTAHPAAPVDAHVAGPISEWRLAAGDILGGKSGGVVLAAADASGVDPATKTIEGVPVLAVLVPLGAPADAPYIHHTTKFTGTPEDTAQLRAALEKGKTVDVDVRTALNTGLRESNPIPPNVPAGAPEDTELPLEGGKIVDVDAGTTRKPATDKWGALEDYLEAATKDTTGNVILSNILPPPDDLSIPIVKLLNHPTYRAYQANTATLSLIPRVHLRFQPPAWGAPTPPTPRVPVTQEGDEPPVDGKEKREWKRRVKMYIGPALEAFGYERLVFGSAPSSASSAKSSAGDWYELARESLAELGVEQEAIDAVFMGNARRVYGAA